MVSEGWEGVAWGVLGLVCVPASWVCYELVRSHRLAFPLQIRLQLRHCVDHPRGSCTAQGSCCVPPGRC